MYRVFSKNCPETQERQEVANYARIHSECFTRGEIVNCLSSYFSILEPPLLAACVFAQPDM
jgi:hypothetical protein